MSEDGDIESAEREKNPMARAIREFTKAANAAGTVELQYFELADGTVGFEQTLFKNDWPGLGYDREHQTLWLCLDSGTVKRRGHWDANTTLDISQATILEREGDVLRIKLPKEHPIARLVANLPEGKNAYFPGNWNNWQQNEASKFRVGSEGDVTLEIPGGVTQVEGKVALLGVKADWQDGQWNPLSRQRLELKL